MLTKQLYYLVSWSNNFNLSNAYQQKIIDCFPAYRYRKNKQFIIRKLFNLNTESSVTEFPLINSSKIIDQKKQVRT